MSSDKSFVEFIVEQIEHAKDMDVVYINLSTLHPNIRKTGDFPQKA